MRRKIIIGNWKLNNDNKESIELAKSISLSISDVVDRDVVLCPTAVSLKDVSDLLKDSFIETGAQNVWHCKSGAFTGEISVETIKKINVRYVLVGHSERRKIFSETDEMINKKVIVLLEENLFPVLCIGESLEDRQDKKTKEQLRKQIIRALKDVSDKKIPSLLIAYEPIWAIGTGKTASFSEIQDVHFFIRSLLAELYSQDIADSIRIAYGGSVDAKNSKEILTQSDVDGVLVGGASLFYKKFVSIIRTSF